MGRFSHIIEKTFYVIGGLFAFFLVLGIVLHFLEPERDYEKDPKRVSESAYAKYTKESHSDLYEKYQDEGIARIKDLERLAVNKLATTNNACNEIVSVGFAGKETFINDFTVLVECANKERFYVSETDIKNNRVLLPLSKGRGLKTEKTSNSSKANQSDAKKEVSTTDKKELKQNQSNNTVLCQNMLKRYLNYPKTFDQHWGGIKYRNYGGLNYMIDLNFSAKNAFGVESDFSGTCEVVNGTINSANLN